MALEISGIPCLDRWGVDPDFLSNQKPRRLGFEIIFILLSLLFEIEILAHQLGGLADWTPFGFEDTIALDRANEGGPLYGVDSHAQLRPKSMNCGVNHKDSCTENGKTSNTNPSLTSQCDWAFATLNVTRTGIGRFILTTKPSFGRSFVFVRVFSIRRDLHKSLSSRD